MRRAAWLGVGAFAFLSAVVATIAPGGPAKASAASADDGAFVVGERRLSDRVLDLTIYTPVLAQKQHVRLLLPPGWRRDSARSWPTLWLLHGASEGYESWTGNTDVEALTDSRELIVVMPDGGPDGLYTDWWNGGTGGKPKWETFHLTELRQILERGYRAGARRAIAGNASAGAGALAYAARHRGMFRAAASFSGTPHTLYENPAALDAVDLVQLQLAITQPRVDWQRVWGHPKAQRPIWRQHNPYDLVTQLTGVRLYISCGTGAPGPFDQRARPDILEKLAHLTTMCYVGKLKKLGVPATTHFYDGTQSWPYWQRELHAALPVLLSEIL